MEPGGGRIERIAKAAWREATGPLYRNAIFLMMSSTIGLALGFVFWVITLRVYSENDAGFALALMNTISFLAGLASLGLGIGIIRFLPETDDPSALVNTSLSIAGAVGGLLGLVFALGVPIWAPDLGFVLETPVYLVVIVLTSMAYAFAPILDQTAIAVRRADLSTLRTLVFSVLKIPLPLLFVLWFSGPLGGRLGVFLSIAIAFGASVLLLGLVLLPRVIPGFRPRPRLSRRRVRPIFAFSLGNWLAGVIGSAAILLQSILILNVLGGNGASSVAYFYAAFTIAGLLYVIPQATMTSFLAEASHLETHRRRDERKAVALSVGLLVPGILAVWFLAPVLMGLFEKPGYVEFGTWPLRILSLAAIPVFLNGVLVTRVRIRKQVWPLIASSAILAAVTLGLGYALLGRIGIDGLAYAFLLAETSSLPLLWVTAGAPIEAEPMEAPAAPPQAGN